MTDEEKKQVQALVHSAHRIQTGLWLAASIWLLALAGAIGQQVARALGYTAQLPRRRSSRCFWPSPPIR